MKFLEQIRKKNADTRDQWCKNILEKIPAGKSILDAGAGEQRYRQFCSHLKYTSQDFAQYDGMGDNHALQTKNWDYKNLDIVSDIVDIPVDAESFDAVMCTEVCEHLPDPIMALKELTRVLKPGGILILTAPFASLSHFTPYHYYSGFNRYFYLYHLEKLGYEQMTIEPNGNYIDYLALENLRLNGVLRRYCHKSLSLGYKFLIWCLLKQLYKMNRVENNSSELCCWGYHVTAIKK